MPDQTRSIFNLMHHLCINGYLGVTWLTYMYWVWWWMENRTSLGNMTDCDHKFTNIHKREAKILYLYSIILLYFIEITAGLCKVNHCVNILNIWVPASFRIQCIIYVFFFFKCISLKKNNSHYVIVILNFIQRFYKLSNIKF